MCLQSSWISLYMYIIYAIHVFTVLVYISLYVYLSMCISYVCTVLVYMYIIFATLK